jgi:membrane-associated phospholipid phosphatase
LAILVGISRIYLLAHFKEDVLFGSFLGVLSALLPIYLLEEKNKI